MSKHFREMGLLIVLICLSIGMSLLSPYFLDFENLMDLTRHLAEIGIIACGMTFIIMSGGIDLSVGSLLGLCGIVLGYTWQSYGALAALVMVLVVGLLGGSINGALITRLRLPPLVVTLATMALYRGGAMIISKAQPVSEFPEWFEFIGQGYLGFVPAQLPVWLLLVVLSMIVVAKTPLGRYVIAVGDNERAARFAAIPTMKLTFFLYAATGVLCALASVIYTSRFSTAKADAGMGLELEVITAVVLGGTSITGGRGTILGTFLGVLILGCARNGLNLAGISSVWQAILAGTLLIVTAILNNRLASRR